jgi:hypothetical protein
MKIETTKPNKGHLSSFLREISMNMVSNNFSKALVGMHSEGCSEGAAYGGARIQVSSWKQVQN